MELSKLPVRELLEPSDQDELQEMVKQCAGSRTPIYPVGGGTSLSFGLPSSAEGVALSLKHLNRVVDYPARDMTVTVEAGMTVRQLSDQLAKEGQSWPIDVPDADQATLGGVVATNFNGPRRYGLGSVRDFVIGIDAISGRGERFKGGGRVVKNVAGYDFCKLLTGSLGTLGILTQFTFRLLPQRASWSLLACQPDSWTHLDALLGALGHTKTSPTAIEVWGGSLWQNDQAWRHHDSLPALGVTLEGSDVEVAWMTKQLSQEWREQGVRQVSEFDQLHGKWLWDQWVEFPAPGVSALVVKASIRPSRIIDFVQAARKIDSHCSYVAHAGSGIVIVRFAEVPPDGVARTMFNHLRPVAGEGNVVVWHHAGDEDLTHQCVWGIGPFELMSAVKREFDPDHLLNQGRYVYV